MDFLPQELIDAVIDQLGHDTEALKICALVCRSFFPLAQRLLFSTVTLEPNELSKRNPSVEFRNLISTSPNISPLVRTLTIFNFMRGRTSWFSQDREVVPQILDSLPNLQKVTLSGRHYDRRWDGSSDMNALLCNSFSRPHILSLSLIYASFLQPSDFLLLFRQSTDLRELRLLNVYISDQFTFQYSLPEPEEGVQRPKLRSLAIQNVPLGLIDVLHTAVDLSSLRKLQFWSDHGNQSDHLQRLLEAADDLQDVTFHGFSSSTNGLDISHVPRIKCYFSNFHSDRVANHTVLSGLTELFFQRYPRGTSRMRHVTFHVRSHPKAIIDCPAREWRRLEDAMIHVKERVRFEIPVRDLDASMGDPLEKQCVEAIKIGMPRLHAKGVLQVAMVEMMN